MRNRWTAYAGVSAALAGGVVVKALAQRPNFYSAAVYLSQSNANLMILTNLVFVTSCTLLLGLQKLLYGPLRPIEVEQLYEKAWFAVTETCLAMTIFRGEIGAWFLVMFFSLLAGKVWGWIGEGRVEILEQQPPRNPRLFHTRLALSLGLSVLFDLTMLEYIIKQVMHMARPDMMVMFGFEFAVLSITSLSTAARYAINLAEIGIVRGQKVKRMEEMRKERIDTAVRQVQAAQEASRHSEGHAAGDGVGTQTASGADLARQTENAAAAAAAEPIDENEVEVEGWEGKGRWVFYLDLTTDFFKLMVYLSFFFILLIFYGLPLHIMRDVFLTCRSFFKRIGDFVKYRTATRDMNARYPDATEAEIGREDVCIICREEMRSYQAPAEGAPTNPVAERMRPKKLPCGHILHFSCLRSWLERQQICPTCRAPVVPASRARSNETNGAAPGAVAAGAQHDNAQPEARARPRVYQLGPLRIGVGAARGNNMFNDLQQQLANAGQAPAQAGNENGPQQYGLGIRWDGLRRRGQQRRVAGTVQEQLDAAGRQLQRDLDSLSASMQELTVLRAMQTELARLRAQREGGGNGLASTTLTGPVAPPPHPVQVTNLVGANGGSTQQNILQAGSDQLPEGVTLPEGWTLMPLRPVPPPVRNLIPHSQPIVASPLARPTNPDVSGMPLMSGMPNMRFGHGQQHTHQISSQFPMPNSVLQQGSDTAMNSDSASASNVAVHTHNEAIREATSAMRANSNDVLRVNTPNEGVTRQANNAATALAILNGAGGPPTSPHNNPGQAADSSSQTPRSVPTSAAPSLPSWGSAPTTLSDQTAETQNNQEGTSSVLGSDTPRNGSAEPSSSASNDASENETSSRPKPKSATVEDLVEGPD